MTSKLLAQLLFECTQHYRDRGFPESALIHLRWVLITNTCCDQINLHTAYQSCHKTVKELLGHFKRCPQQDWKPEALKSAIKSADAVFGFACGYRMKKWSGIDPTEKTQVENYRIPGANNAVLAEQARQLHRKYKLTLYLQFEIADAIGKSASVAYESNCQDQGTNDVLKEFVKHYKATHKGKKPKTVVLVAHRHHYDRCQILLKKKGIRAIQLPDQYSGYDTLEAQPRAMTAEDFIVNDFASMAGMAKAAKQKN